MIAVVGNPFALAPDVGPGVAGPAARAASAAAKAGAAVELVGKIGDDARGDEVVLALAAARVGHVAVLRDPWHATPVVAAATAPAATIDADDDTAPAIHPGDAAMRPSLDAADVELALRYLPDQRAIVVAEPQTDAIVRVVVDAAAYAGAALVLVVPAGWTGDVPAGALVLEQPGDGGDGAFATLLGELAAELDRGVEADAALRDVIRRAGAASGTAAD